MIFAVLKQISILCAGVAEAFEAETRSPGRVAVAVLEPAWIRSAIARKSYCSPYQFVSTLPGLSWWVAYRVASFGKDSSNLYTYRGLVAAMRGLFGVRPELGEAQSTFFEEFRGSGLRWAACAGMAGSVLFAVFLIIGITIEEHSSLELAIRAFLSLTLAVLGLLLWLGDPRIVRHYVPVVGAASGFALGGTVLLLFLNGSRSDTASVQASLAIIFALSVHYAFLRLPLYVSAVIGVGVTAAAVVFATTELGTGAFIRNAVYLVFANVLGVVLSYLVESRERELFLARKRAEAARTEAGIRQAAAEAADEQKTRLIAAVSHDLRQPMTAALAFLDVVQRRLNSNDLAAATLAVEQAQGAVGVLGTTLDHLLTAARYDSGTEALQIGLVELNPLFRDVYEAHIDQAERRGVSMRFRPFRDRIVLRTDSRSLRRVLSNLISNAIKYSCPSRDTAPRVLVAARLHGGTCRIDVIDSGIGVPPDKLAEIWKPFVQLNNVERDRERGLGLGLFLVQKIVQQLPGHSIQVRSVPGRGSRFTLTLPAAKLTGLPTVAVPESTASTPDIDLQPLSGAYVLVLEDDRDTRIAVVEMLEAWGLEVSAGATMAELMSAHADSDRLVDAIVCDYRLAAGTNGVDAIASLRERLGYAPHAVLVTGEPDIAPIRARAGPETTVLHKPFPPDSLARPLIRAVQATRLLEEG